MKVVVNIQGTVQRVEIAVKMVIMVEDMQTNEVNLIVDTRRMEWMRMGMTKTANANVRRKEVEGNHSRILLQLYNMALIWGLAQIWEILEYSLREYGLMQYDISIRYDLTFA